MLQHKIITARMEDAMLDVRDEYLYTKDRKVLTEDRLGLPALRTIGHAVLKNAILPLKTHIHGGCMEIVAVIRGKQTYQAGGKSYALKGGDVFVSFTDQPHGSGESPQEVNEILWFQLDMRPGGNFLGLGPALGEPLRQRLLAIREPCFPAGRGDIRLLADAFDAFCGMDGGNILTGQSLLILFLDRICRSAAGRRGGDSRIGAAQEYIRAHIGEVTDLAHLAELCGLSESRFKHLFAEETGIPPRQYINEKKIESAGERIRERGKNSVILAALAMELGFSSPNYFSAVYRKYTGRTPSEERVSVKSDSVLADFSIKEDR